MLARPRISVGVHEGTNLGVMTGVISGCNSYFLGLARRTARQIGKASVTYVVQVEHVVNEGVGVAERLLRLLAVASGELRSMLTFPT